MTSRLINNLAQKYQAEHYLEIGVCQGTTFLAVDMPSKTGVAPLFRFDVSEFSRPGCHFISLNSDDFFASLPRPDLPPVWDIVYIDGLHHFEQAYRDFENSLRFSHENSLIIMDDTVPCNPFSALRNHRFGLEVAKSLGLGKVLPNTWHGDVYKTLLAIHDFHPEFSYCTIMDIGNPKTILWRAEQIGPGERKAVFSSPDEIAALSYFDLLEKYAHLLMPVELSAAMALVGMPLVPGDYQSDLAWKKLMYWPILSGKP